jgi:predicted integral membrane protein DUF2269
MLSLHVLAAIVAIGPVTVAASMFPSATRRALASSGQEVAVVTTLYRICRVYGAVGIAVPVFGFATAGMLHVTGSPWVIASIVLTALAAAVLLLLVLPGQEGTLAGLTESPRTESPQAESPRTAPARLAMYTGVFNLLWAAVTVLMIVRPGSTTGV